MMKPRIKLWGGGCWTCMLVGSRIATGETPLSAYRNWCFVNGLYR